VSRLRRTLLVIPMILAATSVPLMNASAAYADVGQDIAATATSQLNPRHYCGSYPSGCSTHWCAIFATWVWNQHGIEATGELDWGAISFYRYGVNHGTLSQTPHVGDAAVFAWDSDWTARGGPGTWATHVAIVTQVSGNAIRTVGGNEGWDQGATSWNNSWVGTAYYSDWHNTGWAPIRGFTSPIGGGQGAGTSGSITGDSRADLIYWSNGQAVYYRNTGLDANGAVMWDQGSSGTGFWVGSEWWQPATTYYFADITGDGRSDLVYRTNGGAVYYRNTGLDGNGAVMWDQGPNGLGFWVGSSWGLADTAYYFADITGDGRDDLVYRINGGAVYYRNTGVDGNGAVMWDQGPGGTGFWAGSSWGLPDANYRLS
jgi:CHAP domain/FG-GAP-like repeat